MLFKFLFIDLKCPEAVSHNNSDIFVCMTKCPEAVTRTIDGNIDKINSAVKSKFFSLFIIYFNMPRLSEMEKVRIVILREQGKSLNEIKKKRGLLLLQQGQFVQKWKKLEAWKISLQVAVLLS